MRYLALFLPITVLAQPQWLTFHAEQRTRYETSDMRYRPGELGGDQQLAFRTRLAASVTRGHWSATGELQDSRVALTDLGSTVNTSHVSKTRVLQARAGYRFTNLFERAMNFQVEAGRFTLDLGGRRLVGRNNFRNTTNAFDGVLAKFENRPGTVSLQAFDFRPVAYTYPGIRRDVRFGQARLKGVFLKAPLPGLVLDAYLLHMDDGPMAPVRRKFYAPGVRASNTLAGWSWEAEAIWQRGRVAARDHRANLVHLQAARRWAFSEWTAFYDYASGDRDPSDGEHNAFDSLYGPRNFEFGPTGTWGIYARSNLNSPAAQILVRPGKRWDVSVRHRLLNMAEARDQWRGVGLADASGQAGTYLGQQTEARVRIRWRDHFEWDTGYVFFREGSFVEIVRQQNARRVGHFFYAASTWRI